MTSTATLDRAQREALRREIEIDTNGWGDFHASVKKRDRAYCVKHLRRLQEMLRALDAIGWTEETDAPEQQRIEFDGPLRAWAEQEARALRSAFDDFEPGDADLDAYAALAVIGGA